MCKQGRAAEAISCYEHVALLQPESPEAHANLASAYKDAARQDTAIQRYQQVQHWPGSLVFDCFCLALSAGQQMRLGAAARLAAVHARTRLPCLKRPWQR